MGEPIKLPDGRIAYGQAQAASMRKDTQGAQDGQGEAIVEPVVVQAKPAESVNFTKVRGVNDEVQTALYNAGYLNWEDILQAGVIQIRDNVEGVRMSRARALFAMAQ
jgi:hypothetical protein